MTCTYSIQQKHYFTNMFNKLALSHNQDQLHMTLLKTSLNIVHIFYLILFRSIESVFCSRSNLIYINNHANYFRLKDLKSRFRLGSNIKQLKNYKFKLQTYILHAVPFYFLQVNYQKIKTGKNIRKVKIFQTKVIWSEGTNGNLTTNRKINFKKISFSVI